METAPSLEACRICANFYVTTNEMDFLNLFEPTQPLKLSAELEFIEAELRAWQLNISCNDGLPQRICGNCFTKFCSIYSFRQECMEAQNRLLQAFVEGDCAVEEVVTAQDFAQPVNDQVESEVTVGMEGILPEIQPDDVAAVPLANVDNLQYVNENIVIKEQEPDLEKCQINLPQLNTNILQIRQTFNESLVNQTNFLLKNETTNQESGANDSQDLEEILLGNIIPKIKQQPSESSDDNDFNDLSDSSLIFDDDDEATKQFFADNPLACHYCDATKQKPLVFLTADALSQHFFDAHDPTFPYTCPECPQNFSHSKLRRRHVQERHSTSKPANKRTCKYCGKAIFNLTLNEHLEICEYLGNWDCEECGIQLKQVTHAVYKEHIQREHLKKQFKCEICGRFFVYKAQFENHKILHIRNEVVCCNECKDTFPTAYDLRKHKYKIHNGNLPVNCGYCDKGFVTYAFLNRHMTHFHPDKLGASNASDMTCNNCGVKFTSLHKLRIHQQKPCDENGKCINPPTHRQRTHNGVYPCFYCPKRFYLKTQLQKHIVSHDSNKRPYKCDKCHIMCRSPSELKIHQDVAHMQIKAFECEQCGKKFGYKKDLRDHMLYHENLSIPCPEPGCGYICKNDKLLNEHIRHKHRLVSCEYCNETFTHQRLTLHLRNVHQAEANCDAKNIASTVQKKVAVEFLADRAANEIILREQPEHDLPEINGIYNNPYEDYAMEQIVEQEPDIEVT